MITKQRTGNPSSTWRFAVHAKRENQSAHWSSSDLEQLLWANGFGATSAAAMVDWWCSCHPENVKDLPGQQPPTQPARPNPPMTAAEMGAKGGSAKSDRKTASSAANGAKGGWPKGKPRKPTTQD